MAGDVRQALLLLLLCAAVFIKVSVSVFSNQRRRVGAAFAVPGRLHSREHRSGLFVSLKRRSLYILLIKYRALRVHPLLSFFFNLCPHGVFLSSCKCEAHVMRHCMSSTLRLLVDFFLSPCVCVLKRQST